MVANRSSSEGRPQDVNGTSRCHRPASLALSVWAVVGILLLPMSPALAADYTVKPDGSGSFRTIQACADAARAGDTCLVYAGVYNEHVGTVTGGTGETSRVVFRAQGTVTMQGFDIKHPWVTIEGFDITGQTWGFSAHIGLYGAAHFSLVINNVIRDGAANVSGIAFFTQRGVAPNDCIVRGNRLSRLLYQFLMVSGDRHLFENNRFEYQQGGADLIRLFGSNHVFRRNIFWKAGTVASSGGHADFVQTFGSAGSYSENNLFEENWIQDLMSQFSQVNSGDGNVFAGILYSNVRNLTFRRNVIVSVSNNANIGMPGVRFENNTLYRMAYDQGGLGFGGSLTRGEAPHGLLRNNIMLAGGNGAAGTGYYSLTGELLSKEALGLFVTSAPYPYSDPMTTGIYDDLLRNGYIGPNGIIMAKTRDLKDVSQFVLDGAYANYKQAAFDTLTRTAKIDLYTRTTFSADYNYVAGPSPSYAPRDTRYCESWPFYPNSSFCEPHGINGGDPNLRDVNNPLGPDGIPFTLDDGLKPLPTSPLCGKGEGGADVGAYSCDPYKVFSNQPKPPGNLIIR